MTSVKNQGLCGSAWAFSTVAFFEQESIMSLNETADLDLSEQYLVSCDTKNLYCREGFLETAMD